MKRLLLTAGIILSSLSAFGQGLPNFILPDDNYTMEPENMAGFKALSKEIQKGNDPSFETVSAIFPHYMDYPKALVGIKEHHGRFLTSWDGSIIFPPHYISFEVWQNSAFKNMEVKPVPFSSPDVERVSESLVGDWLPVVNRKFSYKEFEYDQTVLAIAESFDTDKPLVAWVKMTVKNNSKQKKSQELSVLFQGTGARPSDQIWATSGRVIVDNPMLLKADDHVVLNENNDVVFWSSREDGTFGDDRLTYRFMLEPDQEDVIYFCMPFEPVHKSKASLIKGEDFDQTYSAVKSYWTDMMANTMQINVPESIVNNAYRTWQVNNFLLVQQDKHRLTYKTIDAPFFYEGIFGYAAAMYLNTITTAGYYDEAKRCARMFLNLQREDGSISGVNRTNSIIPHQHGAILYTISQIYRMGRDTEWFTSVVPELIKGCNWISNHLRSNRQDRESVAYGLLPPLRCNVDNAYTSAQEYSGNAWCWAGMNEVGVALKELGGEYAAEGERIIREADQYRKDILASMDKAAVVMDDAVFIPLDISVKTPYPYAVVNNETFYYTWISSRMLESMIFDKDDPRMAAFTNYFEYYKGIILGLCRMGGSNKLGYTAHFAGGYGISNLRMGKLDRSLLNFYAMFSYGQARNLYATQEHDNFLVGENDSWYYARQPHLHSTSELLRITNKMLIYEEKNNEICLAFGIPKAWLEDGKTVEVKNSQTCFGPVSYRIDSKVADKKMHVTVRHDDNKAASSVIKVKLRHPQGKAISKVEVNGQSWTEFDHEVITLPQGKTEYDLNVFFK